MISMTNQQTPYSARFCMPVGTLAQTWVTCVDVELRVKGTSVPAGIATKAAVRPYAFDLPGIRCWSPPV